MTHQMGLHHTNTYARAATAMLTTPWLSMGSLHNPKRLHAIGLFLDTKDSNISVDIAYRVQGETSWTTALTGGTGQRITVEELDVEFYEIQLRYTLANAGNAKQVALSAISLQYSMNV